MPESPQWPRRRPGSSPTALVLATESWFVAGHFLVVIEALREAGLHPMVVTRAGRGSDVLEAAGCTIVDTDFERRSGNSLRALGTALRLRRILREVDPALVHLIGLKPIIVGLAACLTTRPRPTVVHLTGMGISGVDPRALVRLRLAVVMRLIAAFVSRSNVHLLTENLDDRQRLERHGARLGTRHTLLGGAGVDPGLFSPGAPPSVGGQARLGFVGRLVWSKGLDVLVEAVARVRAAGTYVSLSVFGDVDEDNPKAVSRADLHRWGEKPGIHLHGHVDDIPAAWSGCDIAVVPSRGGEGLPRALLEAAAAGRPLIVTNVSGCRDFVREGREGLVVPPDDPEALASAIRMLARDPDLQRRMGRAARARLMENYTTDAVRSTLVAVYRKALSE